MAHPRWLVAVALVLVLPAGALGQEAVIERGDVLAVSVVGEQGLSGNFTVSDDGFVTLPLAGRFDTTQLTCTQLTEKVRTALARYVKNPMLSIAIGQRPRRTISVAGQVRTPGTYEMGSSTTLLQAVGLAGGPQGDADLGRVRLTRRGESTVYDLTAFERQNDASQNPILVAGDDILVPAIGRFFVTGAVQKPGAYLPTPGLTLPEALAMAGGYTPKADLAAAVLTKASGEKTPLDLSGLARGELPTGVTISQGDALHIPETSNFEITLLGGFKQDGRLSVPADSSVLSLLALAGTQTGAKIQEVRIVRQQGGKPVSRTVNVTDYINKPTPQKLAAMMLEPGDMVYLPPGTPPKENKWLNWLPNVLVPLLLW